MLRVPSRSLAAGSRRRGVTLVEMLITVGLLVLIMTILVEIFRSATGALTTQRSFAAIDQDIRRIDTLLRQDLGGVTAKMSAEQDVFSTGSMTTLPASPTENRGYFVYGENELADAQGEDTDDYIAFTAKAPEGRPFMGYMIVPAYGVNFMAMPPQKQPLLGKYNRVAISSDFAEVVYFLRGGNLYRRVFLIVPPSTSLVLGQDVAGNIQPGGGFDTSNPNNISQVDSLFNIQASWQGLNDISAHPSPVWRIDGLPMPPVANTLGDLTNRENRAFNPRFAKNYLGPVIPDDGNGNGIPDFWPTLYPGVFSMGLINDLGATSRALFGLPETLAFPFVYPNAYSAASPNWTMIGSIHNTMVANHAPLDLGDPLPIPSLAQFQTWWGFPTKRETLSQFWTDPVKQLNNPAGLQVGAVNDPPNVQSQGLRPAFSYFAGGGSTDAAAALPHLSTRWRPIAPPYGTDPSIGSDTFALPPPYSEFKSQWWQALPEEDLILSNVRSFDVKGYDLVAQEYVDLGYMNSLAVTTPQMLKTLGHEGRIPPLTTDSRVDPQFPMWGGVFRNIGDDTDSTVRLRRVWDSWTTDYTNVPWQTLDPSLCPPMMPPPYPSYPPPYPVPLTGIQIQIRVVDPTNQRVKIHTLRHDFSKNMN